MHASCLLGFQGEKHSWEALCQRIEPCRVFVRFARNNNSWESHSLPQGMAYKWGSYMYWIVSQDGVLLANY